MDKKTLDKIMANMPGAQPNAPARPNNPKQNSGEYPNTFPGSGDPGQNGGWKDHQSMDSRMGGMIPKDPEALKALLMQKAAQEKQTQQQAAQARQGHSEISSRESSSVFLREGQTCYKLIPANESPMPLAMEMGPIANAVGKEYLNQGPVKVYIVEGNQAVDLSNPDYSRMKVLYRVMDGFRNSILVPESAIIKSGPSGKNLLKG